MLPKFSRQIRNVGWVHVSLLSFWGLAGFGLVVGWACPLAGAKGFSIRAAVFTFVFLLSAGALAYLMAGASDVVEVGIAVLTGLLFHRITRAALWHRAHLRSLPE